MAVCLLCSSLPLVQAQEISPRRLTPIVLAVRGARPAVVSIQGQKMVNSVVEAVGGPSIPRQVNGMGTGTIIDERGYILTNYHVVSDVRRIQVTLDNGRNYTAQLIAKDDKTDLAVIKIPTSGELPVIRLGTSSDLMEGEAVIALGNAFGYQQTVTRGIISALGRDVQVSDTQSYDDLIQTDASINPGNSGGPLLNINGEMIGVNVAVRAGAQGIGFAIPIDNALEATSELLNVRRLQNNWHGLVTKSAERAGEPLRVVRVESGSPAEDAGLRPGDEIVQIGTRKTALPLDLERVFLDRSPGESFTVLARRGGEPLELDLVLASNQRRNRVARNSSADLADAVWNVLGMKLVEEPASSWRQRNTRYRGGMRVVEVRPGSSAEMQNIRSGDVLVGMLGWETTSNQDVQYIVSLPNLAEMGKIKFYVLRGQNSLYEGYLNVAAADAASSSTSRR